MASVERWTATRCLGQPIVLRGRVATGCGVLGLPSGLFKWSTSARITRADAPGVAGGQFYGNDPNGALVALRVDGSTAWTSPTTREPLSVGRSRVIALCAEGGLCAIDRATGQRVWRRADLTPTRAIIIGAGLLVVNDPADSLLDATTGANAQADAYRPIVVSSGASMQASNGRLIVQDGRCIDVYALGLLL